MYWIKFLLLDGPSSQFLPSVHTSTDPGNVWLPHSTRKPAKSWWAWKVPPSMQVLEPQHFARGMLELEGEKRQGVRKEREKVLQWILLGDQSLAGWLRRGTPVGGIRLTLLFQPETVQWTAPAPTDWGFLCHPTFLPASTTDSLWAAVWRQTNS